MNQPYDIHNRRYLTSFAESTRLRMNTPKRKKIRSKIRSNRPLPGLTSPSSRHSPPLVSESSDLSSLSTNMDSREQSHQPDPVNTGNDFTEPVDETSTGVDLTEQGQDANPANTGVSSINSEPAVDETSTGVDLTEQGQDAHPANTGVSSFHSEPIVDETSPGVDLTEQGQDANSAESGVPSFNGEPIVNIHAPPTREELIVCFLTYLAKTGPNHCAHD